MYSMLAPSFQKIGYAVIISKKITLWLFNKNIVSYTLQWPFFPINHLHFQGNLYVTSSRFCTKQFYHAMATGYNFRIPRQFNTSALRIICKVTYIIDQDCFLQGKKRHPESRRLWGTWSQLLPFLLTRFWRESFEGFNFTNTTVSLMKFMFSNSWWLEKGCIPRMCVKQKNKITVFPKSHGNLLNFRMACAVPCKRYLHLHFLSFVITIDNLIFKSERIGAIQIYYMSVGTCFWQPNFIVLYLSIDLSTWLCFNFQMIGI